MRTYTSDSAVPYGVFYSLSPLDLRFVGAEGETLAGKQGVSYRRLPTALVIAFGPLFGGLFVMAFPFVVLGAIVAGLGALTARKVGEGLRQRAYLARANWAPQASFLDRPKGDEAGEADHEGEELEHLRTKVEDLRGKEGASTER